MKGENENERMVLMKCRRILKAMQKRKNTVTKCLEKAIIPLKALVNNIRLEVTRAERRIDYKCVIVDFVA